MTLVYLSLAFVIGVYFGSHFHLPLGVALAATAAAGVVAVIVRRKRPLLLGGVCLVLFLCGAMRSGVLPAGDDLQARVGSGAVEAVGVVIEEPEPEDSSMSLILRARQVDGEVVEGNLLVHTTRYPTYRYGDLLTVTGELETPAESVDGFRYRDWLARRGIYTVVYYPAVEVVAVGQGPQPLQWLHSVRSAMAQALDASVAEPEASVAEAMLLGLRHNVPADLYGDFRASGTAHLLAISGLHMAIVSGIVLSGAVWLFGRHRATYFVVTLAVLWAYAFLAGMSPSVARAAIMVSLFLFGAYVGRQRSAITALAFAAALMVAVSPRILWSVSFQLSFAAVAGIVVLAPRLQEWGQRTRAPAVLVDGVAYSVAAIVGTLPLVGYYFGYVSLVGLPATLLVLPVMPAVIVLSALTGGIGLISLPVAHVVGWADWLFVKYVVVLVGGFAALPVASVGLGHMDAAWVWLYYGVLVGAVLALGGKGVARA